MKNQGTRVIAIDDQKTDLDGIVAALHRAGMSVLPILYKGSSSLTRCMPGVRFIFSDINLQPRAAAPHTLHQTVAAVLDVVLHKDNGPWVLVAWTASPDQVADLAEALRIALGPKRAPLVAIGLDKARFLTPKGAFKIAAITKEVRTHIARDPVVGAILDFEARAIDAARDIIHTIVELATQGQQSVNVNTAVADVLKAISKATDTGSPPSPEAVFRTLGPAFEDRLVRKGIGNVERKIWNEAFSKATNTKLSPKQVADLNTSIHLDGLARVGERGSIYVVPQDKRGIIERAVKQISEELAFGHFVTKEKSIKSLRERSKRTAPAATSNVSDAAHFENFVRTVQWCFLEAVAACDASNDKRGARRLLLGLIVPDDLGAQTPAGAHVMALPRLMIGKVAATIFFSARFAFSPPPKGLATIKPVARIRNPLLDAILQHVSGSQSRLGWITF